MSKTHRDWRQERAESRRRVAAINASPDRHRINGLLAGGSPCTDCGAFAVRYSPRDDQRRCAECGAVQNRPAA